MKSEDIPFYIMGALVLALFALVAAMLVYVAPRALRERRIEARRKALEEPLRKGRALAEQARCPESVSVLDRVVPGLGQAVSEDERPLRYKALILRGGCRLQEGQVEPALSDFQAARRLDDKPWDAHLGAGFAHAAGGEDCESALRAFEAALSRRKEKVYFDGRVQLPGLFWSKAQCHAKLRRFEDAVAALTLVPPAPERSASGPKQLRFARADRFMVASQSVAYSVGGFRHARRRLREAPPEAKPELEARLERHGRAAAEGISELMQDPAFQHYVPRLRNWLLLLGKEYAEPKKDLDGTYRYECRPVPFSEPRSEDGWWTYKGPAVSVVRRRFSGPACAPGNYLGAFISQYGYEAGETLNAEEGIRLAKHTVLRHRLLVASRELVRKYRAKALCGRRDWTLDRIYEVTDCLKGQGMGDIEDARVAFKGRLFEGPAAPGIELWRMEGHARGRRIPPKLWKRQLRP